MARSAVVVRATQGWSVGEKAPPGPEIPPVGVDPGNCKIVEEVEELMRRRYPAGGGAIKESSGRGGRRVFSRLASG